MTIRNDDELREAVNEASELIQQIQDYVGRDFSKPAKVRLAGFLLAEWIKGGPWGASRAEPRSKARG